MHGPGADGSRNGEARGQSAASNREMRLRVTSRSAGTRRPTPIELMRARAWDASWWAARGQAWRCWLLVCWALCCCCAPGAWGAANTCPRIIVEPNFRRGDLSSVWKYDLCAAGSRNQIEMKVTRQGLGISWQGWGTTLGDMASAVASLSPITADCIAGLLFSQRGLGLNMVRYHIPGGYNLRYSPWMADSKSSGFWPYPNSMWLNRTADNYQVHFLRLAKRKGVKRFEAIAYSPPWWMTVTNDTTGGPGEYKTNLRKKYRNTYALYIGTVLRYVGWQVGIQWESVSPVNEPLEGWWYHKKNAKWKKKHYTEGCNFNAYDLNKLLPLVRKAVDPRVKLVGVDSWVGTMPQVMSSPGAPGQLSKEVVRMLDRVTVHGYRVKKSMGPASDFANLDTVRRLMRRLNKPIWQTEWGPLGVSNGRDIQVGLVLARKIMQHINILGSEAWFHWQAIHDINTFWGMIRFDFKPPVKMIYLSKQFFTFLHFSRFVPPGSWPVQVSQDCVHTVLAVYDSANKRLSITLINQKLGVKWVRMKLEGYACLPSKPCTFSHYRTSETENFVRLKRDRAMQQLALGPAPIVGETINTYVISNVVRPRKWP